MTIVRLNILCAYLEFRVGDELANNVLPSHTDVAIAK